MDQLYQLYIFILTLTTLFTGKSIQDPIKCVESHVKGILSQIIIRYLYFEVQK